MRINRREKAFLALGILVILVLAYYLLVVNPALSRQETLVRYIAQKESDLKEITALRKEWVGFQKRQVEAERILKGRGERFTLLSYLEGVSGQLGISSKIQYMKPLSFSEEGKGSVRPEGIEIKLDGITTRDLIPFLQKIEHAGKLLNIKRIKIQKGSKDKRDILKVTLQVHTYITT